MNELMKAEIADQPQALRVSLPALREQAATLTGDSRAIHLTGSGDSYIAPLALQAAYLASLARSVEVWPALEAAQYAPLATGEVLVAISVSGEARRTIEAAESARRAGLRVFAISGRQDSTLARLADSLLTLPVASRSRRTPHTTDYILTLLALAVLLERLSEQHLSVLERLPDLVARTLVDLETPVATVASRLASAGKFIVLGAGPSYATALYGAAKLWEAGGITAFPFELEEFAHGPHLMLDPHDAVIIIAPDGQSLPRAIEIWTGLEVLGLETAVITNRADAFADSQTLIVPELAEMWSPFVTSLPLQQLCLGIANQRGYDVVTKAGRLPDPERWEGAHRMWVRHSQIRPRSPTEEDKPRARTRSE